MPLSMKIQPISARESPEQITAKPRSRLRRLFRISIAEKPATVGGLTGGADEAPAPVTADLPVEPSSVCLAKMVQNFLEESNDKQSSNSSVRCNCFNGNGSDGSDADPDGAETYDFLKSLVMCSNAIERSVLTDTARIVERNGKACRTKDELRKTAAAELAALGYDAAVCKSKWEKSAAFPAGEYEYVDVIVGGTPERLIVDIDFRSEFETARSTKAYRAVLQTLPYIFVGAPDRLAKVVALVSAAARTSLKKKGLHFPPWRKAEYVQAKWLAPHTRLQPGAAAHSGGSDEPPPLSSSSDNKEEAVSSLDDQPLFAMSESSGEEDVKVKTTMKKRG